MLSAPEEVILTNKEANEKLNLSDYHRLKLIAGGILEAPIECGFPKPRHTLSQILCAKLRLTQMSQQTAAAEKRPAAPRTGRQTRPVSPKLIARMRVQR